MAETDDLILDIDLNGLEETIANVDGFPADLGRELTLAMNSSLQLLHGQVRDRAPVNVGTLAGSINHQIRSPFPNLVGAVGSPLIYAPVMEYGREPGGKMPPIEPIKLWVIRKLAVPIEEAEGVAWAIAKSIEKKGIEGRHYFQEGLKASEPHIKTLFAGAVGRATEKANE